MDCQMPLMDGYEATIELRRMESGRSHLPIIGFSATATQEDREYCLEIGMDDYLPKPFKTETLREILDRWLDYSLLNDPAYMAEEIAARQPIDLDVISQLSAAVPPEDRTHFVYHLTQLFSQFAPSIFDTLKHALRERNAVGLLSAAGSLRSSSAYLGAMPLAEICARLQSLGRIGVLHHADPYLKMLEHELARVQNALRVFQLNPPQPSGAPPPRERQAA
jgi:CheY-like chemotaxis protein